MKLKARPLFSRSNIIQGTHLATAILFVMGGQANAIVRNWDGQGANANWGTIKNWGNGANRGLPVSGADSIVFGGNANTATTNDFVGLSLLGITFDNTAGAFTLAGNAITLASGGITNSSGSNQTISLASITLGSAQTFDAGTVTGGALTMSSNVINGGFGLTWTGTNNSAYSGILSGTGGLTKTGSGILTLSGANTYTGATLVSAGTLTLGSSDRLANTTALTIAGGSLNTGTALTDTVGSFAMSSGSLLGTGTITAATYALSGGTVTGNLGAGTTTVTTGTTTLNGTSASTTVNVNSGTLTLGSSNRLADAAAVTVAGGSLDTGTALTDTVGTFNMSSGSLTGTGTITAATYGLSGGTLTGNIGLGTANVTTGTTTLNGTAAATAVNVNSGTLALGANDRLANGATVTVAGGILATGTFTDTVGTFNMSSGSLNGTGTITAATYGLSGGTVNANIGLGTANVTGAVALNGTSAASAVNVNSGTLSLGAADRLDNASTVTVGGGILNTATFNDTVGTFNMSSGSLNGTGTITATTYGLSGGTLNGNIGLGTANVTTGTVTLNGTSAAAVNINSGSLVLGANDRLANGATVTVGGGILNTGTFTDTVGTFNMSSGSLDGTGTITAASYGLTGGTVNAKLGAGAITVSGGTTTLASVGRLTGVPTLTIAGGQLTLGGAETVGAFTQTGGTLAGAFTLTGSSYALQGGTVNSNLGAGTTTVTGGTTNLNGTSASAAVNVNSGTLALGASDRLDNAATVTVAGGALNAGAFNDTVGTFNMSSGSLNGTGTITAGTYGLSGGTVNANLGAGTANVTTGTTTLNGTSGASAVNVNSGALALGASNRLDNAANVTVAGGVLDTVTYNDTVGTFNMSSGSLNGTGTITAATYGLSGGTVNANLGAGTTNVSGGTTTLNGTSGSATVNINSGILTLGGNGRLGSGTAVTVASGGSLNLNDHSQSLPSIAGTGNVNLGTSGAGQLTLGGADVSSTFAGVISGDGSVSGGLVKTGTGTLALTGANSFEGNVRVENGTLSINTVGDIHSEQSLGTGIEGEVYLGLVNGTGATLLYTGGAGTLNHNINILGEGSLIRNGGTGLLDIHGTITKSTGTLSIDGGTPGITVSTAILGTPAGITTSGLVNLSGAYLSTSAPLNVDGTLNLGFSDGGVDQKVAGLTGNGKIQGAGNTKSTLTVELASGTDTFSGTIGGNSSGKNNLDLSKKGSGTLILSGSEANTFTGLTNVDGGKLSLAKSSGNAIGGDLHVDSGSVEIAGNEQIADDSDVSIMGGSFGFSGSGHTETVGTFTNNGGSFSTGANKLVGTGNSIYWNSGSNTINAGGSMDDSHFSVTGGTNVVEAGGALNVLSGGPGLEFSGVSSPTITLDSSNGTAGKILLQGNVASTVTAGTAQILSGGSAANAGSVDLDGGNRTFTIADGSAASDMLVSAIISNGSLTKAGLGTLTLTGANTYSGGTTVSAGTLAGNVGSIRGNITNNGNVAFNQSADGTYSSVMSGSGSLTKTGAGTLILGGANTYSGGTIVSAGTLSGTTSTIQGNVTNNASVVFNQLTSGTYAGVVSGSGDLTKNGSGTLILSGANTYTGDTLVSAGALVVNGSLAGGVTVQSGGVLMGNGTVSGATTINEGGIHSVGNSPGIQTFNSSLTYDAGSVFQWDLNTTLDGRGTSYDAVNASSVGGNGALFEIKLAGTQDFTDSYWTADHQWNDIFMDAAGEFNTADWASVFSGGFLYSFNGQTSAPNALGAFTLDGNSLIWTAAVSAVPEPGNVVGLAALVGSAFTLRRRKNLSRSGLKG